jgi:hypothetical protein
VSAGLRAAGPARPVTVRLALLLERDVRQERASPPFGASPAMRRDFQAAMDHGAVDIILGWKDRVSTSETGGHTPPLDFPD